MFATLNLIGLGSDNTPYAEYDRWALVGASFVGVAHSVTFTGAANYIGFGDVTFGSTVPAPGALALLAVVGCLTRRRRKRYGAGTMGNPTGALDSRQLATEESTVSP